MINVLDIDVDLFVNPWPSGKPLKGPIERLSDDHTSWPPVVVRLFIDTCIGSKGAKFQGSFHESHEEVLEQIAQIGQQVRLYHFDSHADLGLGQNMFDFATNFLAIAKEERIRHLSSFKPNEGNWCLYGISCGLIADFQYVTHPEVLRMHFDIPIGMDKWKTKPSDGELLVKRFVGDESDYGSRNGPEILDTVIPIKMHNRDHLNLRLPHIDYCFITRSPRYTPIDSDEVFDSLISTYLKF